MTMMIGSAAGAAALMAAGCALYNAGDRPDAGHGAGRTAGWAGWCAGQLVLLLLPALVAAPPLALLAPLAGRSPRCRARGAGGRATGRGRFAGGGVALVPAAGRPGQRADHERRDPARLRAAVRSSGSPPAGRAGSAACADGRPLAWFLWSAGYGLAALALMAARIDWPFLVFLLLAQGLLLAAGIAATGGADSAALRPGVEPEPAEAAF